MSGSDLMFFKYFIKYYFIKNLKDMFLKELLKDYLKNYTEYFEI